MRYLVRQVIEEVLEAPTEAAALEAFDPDLWAASMSIDVEPILSRGQREIPFVPEPAAA